MAISPTPSALSQSLAPTRWPKIRLESPWEILLIALQVVWLAYTRLFQNAFLSDDAYIHFCNALRWADGHGLVFNVGERVLATTSPVYAIVLGSLHRVTGMEIPRLANGFNFACEVGVMLLSLALLRRAQIPMLFRHGIVLITSFEGARMIYSHAGMEMSLFILVLLALLDFINRGWWPAAGLLLGITGWIRPEGSVAWVAVALALAAGRRWRELLRIYSVAIALAVVVCGLLLAYYGTFMPQSVTAKAHAPWFTGSNGYGPVQFAINIGNLTFFSLFTHYRAAWGSLGDMVNSSIGTMAQLSLMAFGAGWIWRRGRRFEALALGLFFLGYYAFHAILATCIFDWYFVPYYFVSLLLAGVGWWSLVAAVAERFRRRGTGVSPVIQSKFSKLFINTAALCLVLLYMISAAQTGVESATMMGDSAWSALRFRCFPSQLESREAQYKRLAQDFNKIIGPDGRDQVGCIEIGIFGYYFKGRVLDVFGLVSPEALDVLKPDVRKNIPAACKVFPYDVFMHFKPKFVMSAGMFLSKQPPEFLAAYERMKDMEQKYPGIMCYQLKKTQ